MVHDFQERLEMSHRWADAHWWRDVYREAFPTMMACVDVRKDGWAQRGGIDRVLTLECGRTINIDEKVREKDYPDIFLEYWSSLESKTPGWVAKDLATDFLAYAFIPSKTCYLIPFLTLRQAWRQNHKAWVEQYGARNVPNNGYTTVGVPVPINVLFQSLKDAMMVTWSEDHAATSG